jgi:seryl-tRNA synthetase
MLDRKFVVENLEQVRQNCQRRGVRVDLDHVLELDRVCRTSQTELEELNRRANEVSKSIGAAANPAEREARKEEGRKLRERSGVLEAELGRQLEELGDLLRSIPNMTHPEAPIGGEAASREIQQGQTPVRKFDFQPRNHVEIAKLLDLVDFEAGANVAGHGFYFLKNEAVLLELALQQYAVNTLIREGFTPIITPDLARSEVVQGIGFIPRGPETQIYAVENSELCLIATAEITLGGMFAKQTLDFEQLPVKMCGISHCFRTEAGAHGAESRGLYRVHQFTKVEMFAFTLPEQSDAIHADLCQLECRIFDALEIPYRVIDTATGDLGGPAYRKFDLEAWMPGRGDKGSYGEITSTSNCTDYQARRLGIRYRKQGEKGTHFVHTLNGTAVACSRAIIAILENYQERDGSVTIPKVLRPYVGSERIVPKV